MLDIGGWEIFVILAIALIVVGPKDLPVLIRNVGRWIGKARGLARDFQSGIDEAARQADLEDVRKAADVSGVLKDEARKIDTEIRSSQSESPSRPAPASAAARNGTPASQPGAPRPAERDAAPRNGTAASARRSGEYESHADDDDDLLADFQRGVRRS